VTLFSDILFAHAVADQAMFDEIRLALDAGEDVRLQELNLMSEVNDNAYCFLLFARFESAIKARSQRVISAMRCQAQGPERRAWDVVSHDGLYFLNHVALLTDKGGSDYRDIQELYKDRNAIAHGRFAETKPNVPAIAAKLSGILSRLEGIP
jgi:hypothetical protein